MRRSRVFCQTEETGALGSPVSLGETSLHQGVARLMYQLDHSPTRPMEDGSTIRSALSQTPAEPSPFLARSLARTGARSRLETELRGIAVDLLGRCQRGELPGDCAEWLATTVEAAVSRVCDSSLALLAETLDSRLDAAPPRIARRLEEAEVRHDAGYVG
jgi:hypothetical protein